ncbi:hypothetical protein FHT77_004857 [Rhizobium sp. BK181]|uniref:hypothetical protein n=1 Tax=Rhizobium sp. BK181 TaxID=2587072 RepID=UPI00161B41AF|nr:hypothetical protein [Rhizobium sp. BK181]MBB3318948.1 hypothetical protein [Rhizobium sp. BK181]
MSELEETTVEPGGVIQMTDTGQVYQLAGWIRYVRKDGGKTRVGCWVSQCPNCGRLFSAFVAEGAIFQPNRRCARHAAPGRPVFPKRRRK